MKAAFAIVPQTVYLDRLRFQIGDLITRDGTDVHRVLYVDEDGHSMEVLCVKAPAAGWCQVGDKEFNLCRRYNFAGKVVDAQ